MVACAAACAVVWAVACVWAVVACGNARGLWAAGACGKARGMRGPPPQRAAKQGACGLQHLRQSKVHGWRAWWRVRRREQRAQSRGQQRVWCRVDCSPEPSRGADPARPAPPLAASSPSSAFFSRRLCPNAVIVQFLTAGLTTSCCCCSRRSSRCRCALPVIMFRSSVLGTTMLAPGHHCGADVDEFEKKTPPPRSPVGFGEAWPSVVLVLFRSRSAFVSRSVLGGVLQGALGWWTGAVGCPWQQRDHVCVSAPFRECVWRAAFGCLDVCSKKVSEKKSR